jgi:hypothetical protein
VAQTGNFDEDEGVTSSNANEVLIPLKPGPYSPLGSYPMAVPPGEGDRDCQIPQDTGHRLRGGELLWI